MTKVKIVSDPKILNGKPIIADTRISVELIMNFLGAGMSIREIASEYPELKKAEVEAAVEYATELVSKTTSSKTIGTKDSVAILHEITR